MKKTILLIGLILFTIIGYSQESNWSYLYGLNKYDSLRVMSRPESIKTLIDTVYTVGDYSYNNPFIFRIIDNKEIPVFTLPKGGATHKNSVIEIDENGNANWVCPTNTSGRITPVDDNNMIELLLEYKKECYNDSVDRGYSQVLLKSSNDIQELKLDGRNRNSRYCDTYVVDVKDNGIDYYTEDKYVLVLRCRECSHKEPTFKGFLDWLEKH